MAVRTDTEFEVPIRAVDESSAPMDRMTAAAGRTAKAFDGLAFNTIALNQAIELAKKAWELVKGPLEESVKSFKEADKVQRKLANTLAMTGGLTRESYEGWKDFASSVQDASVVNDEQILGLVEQAKAMRLSDEMTKTLVQTSVDLADRLGGVDGAFGALTGTMVGQTRAVAKLLPGIKHLSPEALAAGKGIQMLGEKFKGFGAAAAESLEGAQQQAANALDDFREEVGKTINAFFGLEKKAKHMKEVWKTLAEATKILRVEMLAIRAAIQQTDFTELGRSALIAAASIGAVAISVKLVTLAMATAASVGGIKSFADLLAGISLLAEAAAGSGIVASIGAIGLMALKFLAVAVAVAAVTEGVVILIRNFDRLGDVAKVVGNSFLLIFAAVMRGMNSLQIIVLQGIEKMLAPFESGFLNKVTGGGVEESLKAVRQEQLDLAEGTDQLNLKMIEFSDAINKYGAGLKKGPIGAAIEAISELRDNLAKARAEVKDVSDKLPKNQKGGKDSGPIPDTSKFPKLFTEDDLKILKEFAGPGVAGFAGAANTLTAVPLGMMAAANILLDAVQKLINFVPEILNKIADVINSLTELPLKIAEAIDHVLDSVVGFVKNFLTNIVKMLDNILTSLVDFFAELPEAILDVLTKLPTMIEKLIYRVPDVVTRIIESLATQAPVIGLKMMEVMIARAPLIAIKFMHALIVKLPIAIAKGIINAVSNMWDMLRGIKVDLPDITEQVKSAFSGDSSKLFNIQDLTENARDMAQQIIDAAEQAGETMWQAFIRALKRGWDWLKQLGGKIWEGLKEKAGELAAWLKEKGGMIWNGLKEAALDALAWFAEKGAMIWNGFTAAVSAVATWFAEKGMMIAQGFTDAINALATYFQDKGFAIWQGFVGAVKDVAGFFGDWGMKIWNGLVSAVKDPGAVFASWGVRIWDGLIAAYGKVSSWFGDRGAGIWNGLMDAAKNVVTTMKYWGGLIWQGLVSFVKDPVEFFKSWGTNMFQAFKDALWNSKDFTNAFRNAASSFIDKLFYSKDLATSFRNAAVEFWNKLITFDWGSLIPGGGGDGVVSGTGTPLDNLSMGGQVRTAMGAARLIQPVKPLYAAEGMMVPQPKGRDTVGIMAEPQEFVVNRISTQANLPLVKAINDAKGPLPMGGGVTVERLEISVRSDLEGNIVRDKIWPEIEKRLRKITLDGRPVVAKTGLV